MAKYYFNKKSDERGDKEISRNSRHKTHRMNLKYWFYGFSSLITCFLCLPAIGQDPVEVQRIDENQLSFDGVVNESAWKAISPYPMTSHVPDFGKDPYKKSEIRIAYNDTYLYLSAICYEDNANIQESNFTRDGNWNLQSDQVTITLDTYNDDENAVMFIISPSGARTDQSVRNDFISGDFYSDSWNAIWEAKVDIFEGGWQTEARIPFNVLRFDTKDGITQMGISIYRYSAHDKKIDTYPAISNEYGFFSFSKPSLAQDVIFRNLKNERTLFFIPFVVGSRGVINQLNDTETAYEENRSNDVSMGFNAQYALTNSLNSDLTFNTDFAQVEADNQQINLTRFSLFYPEKRKFFQERSSTFEFNNDGNNKLFYSRRIGLRDGSIVPLWGGGRVVGRVGKLDLGVLSMQSKETSDFSSENYSVVRLRSDVINENSYVGGIATSVLSTGDAYNLGVGTDALLNLFDEEYLKINFAHTQSNTTTNGNFLDNSRVFIEWEKRKNVGFGYRLNYGMVGDAYNPALGFENRFDYWRLGDRFFYNIWMKEESAIQKIDLSINSNAFFSRGTNEVETVLINPLMEITGKNEFYLGIGTSSLFDQPIDTFNISDNVFVVPGSYWNHSFFVNYSTPQVKLFRMSLGYEYGGFYSGVRHAPSLSFNYLQSKYLRLDGSLQYNHIEIPSFEAFDSVISQLTVTANLDVRWSLSAFGQYNSVQDIWVLNSRLRYNPRDGINLYLVYNGNYNVLSGNEMPSMPPVAASLWIVKYSHTFVF